MTKKNFQKSIILTFFIGFIILIPNISFASHKDIRIVDFRGKELVFSKPVNRIVCLIESALSALYMLGVEKKVIAVPSNVYTGDVFKYYSAMDDRIKNKTLPSPGNWEFVSIETVVSLKPDVVIIWSKQTETIKSLEDRGIPVFAVFINRFDDVYREVIALGKLTGSESRANEIVYYTKNELLHMQKAIQKIPDKEIKNVYFMWAQGYLHTSCRESTVNDLIQMAGCRNVCLSIPDEHALVSMEQIIKWNPDLIIMWVNLKNDPTDVINDPRWRSINAVKNKKVYELPEVFLFDLWTLKFQYAVKMVAKWAYPEIFKDINMEKEKIKMLKVLYGNRLTKEL
ncbi:MAG: ABC transporter substrate-binding protein [Thermodesulfovibrionales bacterium]|nr:ABC transporter substrate-binding protein [Thermodesulfovibrionales bacterium]